jgi:hypothetical protein
MSYQFRRGRICAKAKMVNELQKSTALPHDGMSKLAREQSSADQRLPEQRAACAGRDGPVNAFGLEHLEAAGEELLCAGALADRLDRADARRLGAHLLDVALVCGRGERASAERQQGELERERANARLEHAHIVMLSVHPLPMATESRLTTDRFWAAARALPSTTAAAKTGR